MKSIVLVAALSLVCVSHGAGDDAPPGSIGERVRSFHPELAVSFIETTPLPVDGYLWSRYWYSDDGDWPYGVVHILWHGDTSMPTWGLDWPGDFQPHSLAWEDFNGDGKRDLFFFAGFEDVFSTHVFRWGVEKVDYSSQNLIEVYSSENDYSVVIDFERDGHPEILDSGHAGDSHIDNQCREDSPGYAEIPPSVRTDLAKEYHRLAGLFDRVNFTFNMPEAYPAMSMNILDPIKIIRIEGSVAKDVTSYYPEHLQWRIEMLRIIRQANQGGCRQLADSVIGYLQTRITER